MFAWAWIHMLEWLYSLCQRYVHCNNHVSNEFPFTNNKFNSIQFNSSSGNHLLANVVTYAVVTPSRKAGHGAKGYFRKMEGDVALSCGRYEVYIYVAITMTYVAVTVSTWKPSSKRHVDPVVATQTPYPPRGSHVPLYFAKIYGTVKSLKTTGLSQTCSLFQKYWRKLLLYAWQIFSPVTPCMNHFSLHTGNSMEQKLL